MPDKISGLLPHSYQGLAELQQQFDAYQKAGFRGASFFVLN